MATAPSAVTLALCIILITELILAEKDYYDILDVPRDASEHQIKKAFHKLAMKYHPDKNKSPNAEAEFREIAEAYETLSDDKRRREYDQLGRGTFSHEAGGGGGQRFHQPFSFNFDDMFRNVDIFGQNQHFQDSRQKRAFENHFETQRDVHSRHRRFFQGAFGGGMFDDIFGNMEKMFSFGERSESTDSSRFQGSVKQNCRTVTQRRGNMVTTYTECS
ncbi:dnaJ homolog subfamily B member 9 [Denticeps clupeoides]|uniref:DnaJ homolog subfamily B member 9 n=1 Tax=Denticeps clupeoides TaxID=299321 RepID=A0AAY4DFH7_9TELE|nr:dnaJ homolog subfamily B member 9-like [Denticeps clupeoides]XP_028811030.1 dnaJ homolog subfamily B member 9-like [Denticeps clupeoides]